MLGFISIYQTPGKVYCVGALTSFLTKKKKSLLLNCKISCHHYICAVSLCLITNVKKHWKNFTVTYIICVYTSEE